MCQNHFWTLLSNSSSGIIILGMEISHDLVRSPAMQRGNYNKRCAIIAAATAVFVRDGYIGASIDAIAEEASVSRQTIYNQIGDKEKLFAEVVRGITEQGSARLVATLATFPDDTRGYRPRLIDFAVRLTRNCLCDDNSRALRKLIENEGQPLSRAVRDLEGLRSGQELARHLGPLRPPRPRRRHRARRSRPRRPPVHGADRRRPAQRARPDRQRRQLEQAARNGVKTFLRAYGKREAGRWRPTAPDTPDTRSAGPTAAADLDVEPVPPAVVHPLLGLDRRQQEPRQRHAPSRPECRIMSSPSRPRHQPHPDRHRAEPLLDQPVGRLLHHRAHRLVVEEPRPVLAPVAALDHHPHRHPRRLARQRRNAARSSGRADSRAGATTASPSAITAGRPRCSRRVTSRQRSNPSPMTRRKSGFSLLERRSAWSRWPAPRTTA